MKYLFVTEFNEIFQSDELTEKQIEDCTDGILSVIDIENGKELLMRDKWADIPKWEEYNKEI